MASAVGADPRGITILLDSLAAMDLLHKKESVFHCPAEIAAFLSARSADSVLPMVLHDAGLWDRWSDLTTAVQRGREAVGVPSRSGRQQEHFIHAMHVIGRSLAASVVGALELGERERLLDVGGATGTYTEVVLEAHPRMRATLFDLPPVIEMARRRLQERGLLARVDLFAGDFYRDELPGGHDVALLSAIIHQNGPDQNLALYQKIHRALRPGGLLVIRDHVMSADHTQPPGSALFAINMLVGTLAGGTYSFAEIRDGLAAAGFEDVRLLQEDSGRMNGVVTGRKPRPGRRVTPLAGPRGAEMERGEGEAGHDGVGVWEAAAHAGRLGIHVGDGGAADDGRDGVRSEGLLVEGLARDPAHRSRPPRSAREKVRRLTPLTVGRGRTRARPTSCSLGPREDLTEIERDAGAANVGASGTERRGRRRCGVRARVDEMLVEGPQELKRHAEACESPARCPKSSPRRRRRAPAAPPQQRGAHRGPGRAPRGGLGWGGNARRRDPRR